MIEGYNPYQTSNSSIANAEYIRTFAISVLTAKIPSKPKFSAKGRFVRLA